MEIRFIGGLVGLVDKRDTPSFSHILYIHIHRSQVACLRDVERGRGVFLSSFKGTRGNRVECSPK